ncbi:uncharacterized protein DUF2784 [Herbihabitans rhizosphaerae]|uniref:Uncharacterized protein DUF2784 n=1 Tax=Herbihabitans rhizosphaerae TaxID=1872711 RepID=A0A4Q7KRA3_9PSEU|nr:DUF2784 domain-containing protein [Herbihabitans rhizosphaerae]RZS37882.1 uncharacterized protein DUF2784 [Herbihabitans rhizosphaerae]
MAGVLASATVVVHFIALIYIGLGGFLAWKWPKSIFVHIFFALWGVAINVPALGLPCPLTALEDHFRHQQGLSSLPGGFNEYYIYDDLIPRSWLPAVAVIAFVALIVSYVGAFVLWRRRRGSNGSNTPDKVATAG